MPDPLLDCLWQLTQLYGPATGTAPGRAALCAGLPVTEQGLTPELFLRAAARVNLAARVVRRKLDQIDSALLPVVLLLQDRQAALLLGWNDDGHARLLLPDSGAGEVVLAAADLQARYLGVLISCRPQHALLAKPAPRRLQHWFFSTLRAQRRLFYDVLLAALLINLFGLALPLFTMNVYDRVVPNFAEESLWALATGMALVLVFDFALRATRSHFIELASARIDTELSSLIMQRVLGLGLTERPASVGAFAANLRAFEMVRDFITSATLAALVDLPFALLFLIVLGAIAWPLLCAPVLAALLLLLGAWLTNAKMQALAAATLSAQAERNALLVETLSALESVQAHGGQARVQARWEASSGFLARVQAQLRTLAARSLQSVLLVQQCVNVVLVIGGVYLIHDHRLSLGGLIAATMLSGRALAPLGQMVGLLLQWANVREALASLNQIMDSGDAPAPPAAAPPAPLQGAISFHDVSFTYPGSARPALRKLHFQIQAGEKVVIIGRVGSGKSTLHKLLLGLYRPDDGAIRFDGIDARQLAPSDLIAHIGYCEQDSRVFSGTLRENLTMGSRHLDDAACWRALEVAGLADTARQHPLGLNWRISERGESLSGGQRQALALARALVGDAPILLLDEPSSAQDAASEAQFKQRLGEFARQKTVIIITHRASLMDLADRLMVLDDGIIVADGARAQVVADLQAGKVGRAA